MLSDTALEIYKDATVMIPLKGIYSANADSGFRNAVVYGVLMSWDDKSLFIGDGSDIHTSVARKDVGAIFTHDSSFFAGTSSDFSMPEGEEYQ